MKNLDKLNIKPLNTQPQEPSYNSNQVAIMGILPNPNCDNASVSANVPNGGYYYKGIGGTIMVNPSIIENNSIAVYYSGNQVVLKPGFHAKSGSKVLISIRDYPCVGTAPTTLSAVQMAFEDSPVSFLKDSSHLIKIKRQDQKQDEEPSPFNNTAIVSPNPTEGEININTQGVTIMGIQVVNMLGYILFQQYSPSVSLLSIDISKYEKGIYFVNLNHKNGNRSTHRVLQR